jgi:xanthine/uracil permease
MATKLREEARSMTGLIGDVVRDVSDLVRQEIALAKAEASEKLTKMQVALAAIAIGGAVAFAGFIKLLDAAVFALGNVMGDLVTRFPALPALIVGAVVVIIGIIMIKLGVDRFAASNLRLSRTVQSVQRDQAVVKEHLS